MISEAEYFFRGAERLSWGFATPNYLGAFLATLPPLLWGVSAFLPSPDAPSAEQPRKRVKPPVASPRRRWVLAASTGILAIEIALWILLGATGSRGAAVAALGGVILWELLRRRAERRSGRVSAGWVGLRVLFCVVGFAAFSLAGRIAPTYIVRDASIGNRWTLWAGGAALCQASPWTGWGAGESGHLFTQWVQPLDRPQAYKNMVNSFLELGVERGLPSLGGVLVLVAVAIGWPFAAAESLPRHWRVGARAGACVWAAWATVNIFSTLYDDGRLWYVPCLAALLTLVSIAVGWRHACALRRCFGVLLLAGCAGPLAVYAAGWVWQGMAPVRIGRSKAGMVVLARPAKDSAVRWGVLPDLSVFGEKYGHEIRRWGGEAGEHGWAAWIYDPRRGDLTALGAESPDRWLVCGIAAEAIDQLPEDAHLVVLHPRGVPPRHWRGRGIVILNGIDEDGSAAAWANWAEQRGLRLHSIADIGIDARAAWPAAYLSRLAGGLP